MARRVRAMGLKTAREAAKLSQARLARLSGVTAGTIWDLEHKRNKSPAYEKVVRLVRVLRNHGLPDLTESDIFDITDVSGPTRGE